MVGVAQLVEPRIVIPVVVGSSPIVHPSLYIPEVLKKSTQILKSLWEIVKFSTLQARLHIR